MLQSVQTLTDNCVHQDTEEGTGYKKDKRKYRRKMITFFLFFLSSLSFHHLHSCTAQTSDFHKYCLLPDAGSERITILLSVSTSTKVGDLKLKT
jgi:hypothetical protein